ncbi:MAG: hypothetical protein ACLGJC_09565 [Alphaproteobacteria bacterium]
MALETKLEVLPDGTERPSIWKPPAFVSPEMRAEAASIIAKMDAAGELSPQARVRQWLIDLAPLVAGNMALEDARQRVDALVGSLEYPAACFTQASLRKAARRFTFFPGYKELCDFLDAQLADLRVKRQRLEAIVRAAQGTGPKSIAHQPIDYSPEAQERVRAVLAAAGMGLRMPGAAPNHDGAA